MSVVDRIPGKGSPAEAFRRGRALSARWFNKPQQPYREWAEGVFAGFYSTEGPSSAARFRAHVAAAIPGLVKLYEECLAKPAQRKAFTDLLLKKCETVSTKDVRHSGMKLRAYNDVSVMAQVLSRILEGLSDRKMELANLVADQAPNSRAALIVQGEFALEGGDIEAAIVAARQALSIDSSCTTAQKLLYESWMAQRKQTPGAACSEIALQDLSDRFCGTPFINISTAISGYTWLCACGAWLPYSAGDLFQAESAEAVWNSEAAREIRRSILEGDFSYCSRTLCPAIVGNCLPRKTEVSDDRLRHYLTHHLTHLPEAPQFVQLSHDSTCNLACPTCRPHIVVADATEQKILRHGLERVVLPLLRRVQGQVCLTGWGDPFASKHYLALLALLKPAEFPGLQLEIASNRLLLTPPQWEKLGPAREMIIRVKISVDAATAETYEKVRRPARWSQLLANLEFLSDLRRKGELKQLWINFVVQKANFREMLDFIKLGQRLKVDVVFFQKLWNLRGLDAASFADTDVASPAHPWHPELLCLMRDPLMQDPIVMASNLQLVVDRAAAPAT